MAIYVIISNDYETYLEKGSAKMGIKNKFEDYQMEVFMDQYGDRLIPVYGNVLSIKVDRKKKLFLWNTLNVSMVVKPSGSRNVQRCTYRKSGFKETPFIEIRQGNEVMVQGLKADKSKSKDNQDTIEIMNIINITDRTQLVEGDVPVDEIIKSLKGNIKRQRI